MMDPRDLYGLPLNQFTRERNALVKELRGAGRREDGASAAKLRKPSVAAWAVNQLVRTQQREVRALFTAGDALQRAQAELLAKRGDAASLRQAVEAEREAVAELVRRARGLLDSGGHELGPGRLEQVAETLHAAALDDDARATVRAGCLDRELRHVGLGSLEAPSPGVSAKARQPTAPRRPTRDRAEAASRRRLERATRHERSAAQSRDRAAAELASAEEALDAARAAVAEAQAELEQAGRSLEQP